MSLSERALMEKELASSIEGEMSLPTVLVDPNGISYNLSATIDYAARREIIGNDGFPTVIRELAVTMRLSSVSASLLPIPTGNWEIKLYATPLDTSFTTFILEGTRDPEVNATIGTVRVFPKRAVAG